MIADKYVRAMEHTTAEIVRRQAEIDTLYGIACGTGARTDGERVQSSGSGDKMSECVIRIADKRQALDDIKDTQARAVEAMTVLIGHVSSPREREALSLWAVQRLNSRTIADRFCLTERQVQRYIKSGKESMERLRGTDEYDLVSIAIDAMKCR